MPVIDFVNEETGHIEPVYVPPGSPDAAYRTQMIDGAIYKRVYSVPLMSKDTKVNDATQADFTRTTSDKNLKVGEMWEISKEMAATRAEKNGGKDPVTEQFYRDYEKKTGGKHADVKKREARERRKSVMDEMGIRVE